MFNIQKIFSKIAQKKTFLQILIGLIFIFLAAELYLRSTRKFDVTFSQNVINTIKFLYDPPMFTDAHVIKKQPEDYSKKVYYHFMENPVYDYQYGYRMTANCNCRDILKINNKLLWDKTFKTDQFGRRATIEVTGKSKPEQFAVFYGGSRTFGQGVNDDETLASNFQKLNPDLKIYNYGIINSAANVYLRYHETDKFKKEIPEKKGLFIYVYDLGHEQRILGAKEATKSFSSPFYDYDDEGRLAYYDNFWLGRPVRSIIFNLLGFSAVYQNLFLNKRLDKTALERDDLFLVRDVFLKMQKHAAEMSDSKLVVVFFEVVKSPIMTDLSEALSKAGVEVLYYKKEQLPADDNINYYQYDRHPQASTYVTQAALIQEALKQKSWFKK